MECPEISNGIYLWVKIPKGYKNSFDYADYLLETYDLFVAPGSIYGTNGNKYIRLSLTIKLPELKVLEDRIVEINNNVAIP
jgi:LL-diaminopimelate aminotransferase